MEVHGEVEVEDIDIIKEVVLFLVVVEVAVLMEDLVERLCMIIEILMVEMVLIL